jgi:hypothetical protein
MPTQAQEAQPRVIVERGAEGTLILECYENGQRKRLTLTPGSELYEIRSELVRQSEQLTAKRKREQELADEKRTSLHNHNLNYIRRSYGDVFAQRVYGEHFAPERAKAQPKPKIGIEANVDLL